MAKIWECWINPQVNLSRLIWDEDFEVVLRRIDQVVGDAIIRWTARLFVAGYVGRLFVDVAGYRNDAALRAARWLWTAGCVLCVIHLVAAFQWLHHWSHTAAFDHVMMRTAEMTGIESGVGLYINYAFTALWFIDTAIWWCDLQWPNRIVVYWCVQSIFAFLMIQATAVFGPPFWRPLTLVVVAVLIVLRRTMAQRSLWPVENRHES